MDVMQAIHARHSIRVFTTEPVSRETLDRLVSAGAAAPSSMNSQPWRFHIATGATREKVIGITAQSTVYLEEYIELLGEEKVKQAGEFYANLGNAPVVMAVSLPDIEDETDRVNEMISAGAAIQNIMLAATDVGLGSCNITFPHWVGDALVGAFAIPADRIVVSLLLIGHPAEEPASPQHREDVAAYLD